MMLSLWTTTFRAEADEGKPTRMLDERLSKETPMVEESKVICQALGGRKVVMEEAVIPLHSAILFVNEIDYCCCADNCYGNSDKQEVLPS